MNTTRRGFLGALLAASAAPAIVRADSLMKLWVPPRVILWGDGLHDDTDALHAILNHTGDVYSPGGVLLPSGELHNGAFKISRTLVLNASGVHISGCDFEATKKLNYMVHVPAHTKNVTINHSHFSNLPA